MPSGAPASGMAAASLKLRWILTAAGDTSRVAKSFESAPHTNSAAVPKLRLRHASAV